MTDKCLHEIKINNLQNEEVVNHQLLLVKGKVIRRCSQTDKIHIRITDSRSQQVQLQSTQVARSGEFKLLVNLEDHLELNVTFIYCNYQKNLRIYQEVASNCFRIQPLYLICQGEKGEFPTRQGTADAKTACQLIDLNLLLVQSLYAEKLREHGFERQSFTLNGQCQIFHSALTCDQAWNSTENELWHSFGKEILNSTLGTDANIKFVAFIACTKYNGAEVAALKDFSYAKIRSHLKAHAALGGGGLALFGSSYFYAWPQCLGEVIPSLQDESKVDLVRFPDDSNYRRTHLGVYATTLGAVCHELGHIFDLGHTQDGIMGTGFDYLNRVFTIDNLTEHLPTRQVQKNVPETTNLKAPLNIPRFTQLKKNGGDFMEKYHEQKSGDSFYFTRNCAVILAHHLWIKKRHNKATDVRCANDQLTFDGMTQSVISDGKDALKLIEIRSSSNSFVDFFYEFSRNECEKPVFEFKLPACAMKLEMTHYIFVITVGGCTKSLYFC